MTVALSGQESRVEHGRLLAKAKSRFSPRRKGRHEREELRGSEYSVDGEVMLKVRIIDRTNDRYLETVTNERTGEIVRHIEEPLSRHTNRGTARKAKK